MKVTLYSRLLIGAALVSVLAAWSSLAGAQSADSEKINELFKTINQHASDAQQDAHLLDSYTRSRVSWESHSSQVEKMKEHVNDLGRDFAQAKTLRDEGSEWQKEAIDQIEPLLQGLASHLSATINHLNDNQSKIQLKPWKDYVKGNVEYANGAANLIHDYVDYAEARLKIQELEKKLDLQREQGAEEAKK